ncbi:hypothetical protein D3C87_2189170 [compost metagenome]
MAEPGEAVATDGERGERIFPRQDQTLGRLGAADIEAGGDIEVMQRQAGRAQAGRQEARMGLSGIARP